MRPEARALRLLDPLYAGGIDLRAWSPFIAALSDELGGAAITVTTDYDDWSQPQEAYWAGLNPALAKLYERHAGSGLPWGSLSDPIFLECFCRTDAFFPDEQLAELRRRLKDGEDLSNLDYFELIETEDLDVQPGDALEAQIDDFLGAVREGRRPTIDAQAGFAAVRTAERIVETARAAGSRMV